MQVDIVCLLLFLLTDDFKLTMTRMWIDNARLEGSTTPIG